MEFETHDAPDGASPSRRVPPAPVSSDIADSPAARLLRDILHDANVRRASDIHIEPDAQGWRVRLRIDGVLHLLPRPAPALRDAVVTRIKVLSRIDIAERRVPLDGRLHLRTSPNTIEAFRVSTLPTLHGEKLVLRRLDTLPDDLSLRALGFEPEQERLVKQTLGAPHGLLLVTGATGSGKTLTLYAFMHALNQVSSNICTVEDPAELQLDGINQVPIREKAGLTFAVALRALLRQDPDVAMVGEIRDRDTADVAVKAAQTGHLVLSTLHTNDAPSTLARLADIGIESHHLAAAIRLVTAQRLVRRLCPICRLAYRPNRDLLRAAGFTEPIIERTPTLYRASGCEACHRIGYRGRVGIHQVMRVTPALRQLASMLQAGLELVPAFDVLEASATHGGLRRLLGTIRHDITQGIDLSAALGRHPHCFDERCCALVAIGEVSGSLSSMLARVADDRERGAVQRARLRAALTYPLCVAVFGLGVVIVMTQWVLSAFNEIFQGFGAPLPRATRIVLSLSRQVGEALPYVSATCLIGTALHAIALRRLPSLRARCARHLLAFPVMGPLLARVLVARWCRALGTLLGTGVPLSDALDVLARTSGHPVFDAATAEAGERIRKGEPLAGALSKCRVFPASIVEPIAVAEHRGTLDTLLIDLATLADHELESRIGTLLMLIEPTLVALLGILIGGLAVTLYLPIIELGHIV